MHATDVADYLRQHPEFFEENPDLLADLALPSPHGNRAVSLTERQLSALRGRNQDLLQELEELMEVGRANDAIVDRLHRFNLSLFEPASLEAYLRLVHHNLQEVFAIPHTAMRLWSGDPRDTGAAEFQEVSFDVCALADEITTPLCGDPIPEEILPELLSWFGEAAHHLRSFALVPLRGRGESLGLLVLASEDPERFYAGMGTIYLARLGELVSAGLMARLGEVLPG